ncbi:hypothetical protein [Kitasatospora sp. MAP5-34]|uniref:hypothetical protein n=1 Tax=Kitasatospora sp. MAP5-34 TaxID=3035102 RepID=UPI002474CE32|nr:hypothetical protein [Kitasatospora sp. MAP5-34]MDH6574985.1 hypothetical protein [Kitasatospora sp. MAP5-34]
MPDSQLPRRYAMVGVDGSLAFTTGTWREMRAAVAEGLGAEGESGAEMISQYSPLNVYYFAPYDRADEGRMNKVANGVYFELSDPKRYELPAGDEADDLPEPTGRVIKMHGPVAFYSTRGDLDEDEIEAIREAHKAVFGRLGRRGWI